MIYTKQQLQEILKDVPDDWAIVLELITEWRVFHIKEIRIEKDLQQVRIIQSEKYT